MLFAKCSASIITCWIYLFLFTEMVRRVWCLAEGTDMGAFTDEFPNILSLQSQIQAIDMFRRKQYPNGFDIFGYNGQLGVYLVL